MKANNETAKEMFNFFKKKNIKNTNNWTYEIKKFENSVYKKFPRNLIKIEKLPFELQYLIEDYANLLPFLIKIGFLKLKSDKKITDDESFNLIVLMNYFQITFKKNFFELVVNNERKIWFELKKMISLIFQLDVSFLKKNLQNEFNSKKKIILDTEKNFNFYEIDTINTIKKHLKWFLQDNIKNIIIDHNLETYPNSNKDILVNNFNFLEKTVNKIDEIMHFRNIITHHNDIFRLITPLQIFNIKFDLDLFDKLKKKRNALIYNIKVIENIKDDNWKWTSLQEIKDDFLKLEYTVKIFKKSHKLKPIVSNLIDEFNYLFLEFNWSEWDEKINEFISLNT